MQGRRRCFSRGISTAQGTNRAFQTPPNAARPTSRESDSFSAGSRYETMILLEAEGLRKLFGEQVLLDGVTFQVRAGQRIGLVGPNGCGKTTLLRVLAGRLEPDGGTCRLHTSANLAYLEQRPQLDPRRTLHDEAASALAGLLRLQRESETVAEALAATQDETDRRRLAARYDHLQQELARQDAYNLEHKIARVLQGLGFDRASFSQPVGQLSGGEQNRLMLAKLLLAEPNLMLLDEPSNHLDLASTEWLEQFLAESSAAMIIVSHDRTLLDKVTTHTLELFRGTVEAYRGNFSAYEKQKAQRLLVQKRTYEKQQAEIARAQEFIRRNAYGQKHAQAEDRRKKLARIQQVEPPREIPLPAMHFPAGSPSGLGPDRTKRLRQDHPGQMPAGHGTTRRRPSGPRPQRAGGLLRPAPAFAARGTAGAGSRAQRGPFAFAASAPLAAGTLRADRRKDIAPAGPTERRRTLSWKPTSWSSTSRPTIWTSGPGRGWNVRCKLSRARCSSSATIAR